MKTISQTDLVRFVNLTKAACYNAELKEEYRTLGKQILQALAKMLGLKKGEYDIRWNAGGIACSGDHTLHTDRFYLAFHDNIGLGWFYWRQCHGRKDYGTGMDCPNQCVPWTKLTAHGVEYLAKQLKIVQDGQWTDPSSGDIIMNINTAIRMAMSR